MSVLPRIALFLQYVLPRNSRNTQNLLVVYSPTDCTDLHRTFLLYILPQIAQNTQNLLAVYSPTDFTEYTEPSCCMFSHRMHRFTQNLLAVCSPTEFTEYTEPSCCIFSHRLHRFSQMLLSRGCTCLKCTNPFCCCTSCSVGALETSAPPERPYLCRSVKSVGEYFQQPLP